MSGEITESKFNSAAFVSPVDLHQTWMAALLTGGEPTLLHFQAGLFCRAAFNFYFFLKTLLHLQRALPLYTKARRKQSASGGQL